MMTSNLNSVLVFLVSVNGIYSVELHAQTESVIARFLGSSCNSEVVGPLS